MTRKASVFKHSSLVGTLEESATGRITFRYSPECENSQREWVSLTLPWKGENQILDFPSLPSFFDGLIPEGWLLEIATRIRPDLAKDRFGLLLATGRDCIGSVSVVDDENFPAGTSEVAQCPKMRGPRPLNPFGRCLICMHAVSDGAHYHPTCSRRLFGPESTDAELPFSQDEFEEIARHNIESKLVVPGAQRKISASIVAHVSGRSRMTLVGAGQAGLFILKPQHPLVPTFPANEHLAMALMREAGLETAHCGLLMGPDGKLAYVTKRFDRIAKQGAATKKRSVEDFGQLFGRVVGHDKYKESYDKVGKFLKERSSRGLADAARFFDQVFMSYAIGNNDFHLRNVSVFTDENIPMLTPLYDATITQLIDPEPELDVTLALNGKKSRLLPKDWLAFGQRIGIAASGVPKRIDAISSRMGTFSEIIDRSFLPNDQRLLLKAFMTGRLSRALH